MIQRTSLALALALAAPLLHAQTEPATPPPDSTSAAVHPTPVLPTVLHDDPHARWDEGEFGHDGAPSYRWYLSPRLGWTVTDPDRRSHNAGTAGLGVGMWVNPHMTLDLEAFGHDSDLEARSGRPGGSWATQDLFVTGRWYAGDPRQTTRIYGLAGLGVQRHQPVPNKSGWSPAATIGVGVQHNFNDRVALRGEVAAVHDRDSSSSRNLPGIPARNHYTDGLVSVGLVIGLDRVQPYVTYHQDLAPPTPKPVDCSTLDDDHDGVNNCQDRCPETASGIMVGPDGCPQKVVIDLRGVNFRFDHPKPGERDLAQSLARPTADSLALLDQTVDVLQRYPDLKVEVDGYTDSVGSAPYNQALSERRAQAVARYLTTHGIAGQRIVGVKGYGEADPIAPNTTAAGRAMNRRVQLEPQSAEPSSP